MFRALEQAASHKRQFRVTAQKVHQHFFTNARQVHGAELLAGQRAGDAHPAGTVPVLLAITVPGELSYELAFSEHAI
jgi:hypothetical protein